MTVFLALATLMMGGALTLVLPALLRGEPADRPRRWLAPGFVLVFMLVAVSVYGGVGTPGAVNLAEPSGTLEALAAEGGERFRAKDYAGAARLWREVLSRVPQDSDVARSIEESIVKAEAFSNERPKLVHGQR